MPLETALFWLLTTALAICVVTDLRRRRIYDAVTLPAAAGALFLRANLEGLGGLEAGLVSGLVGLSAALVLFGAFARFQKGLGWGDVKLAAVAGAVFGFPLVFGALMFITLAGAVQAIISLLWQGALSDTLQAWARRIRKHRSEGQRHGEMEAPRRHIPYSVAIALGSFWAMWWHRAGGGAS